MSRLILLLVFATYEATRLFCQKNHQNIEMGKWRSDLKHLDSGIVENKPVSMLEGQVYVYENDFPGYTIKYVHVDNLAFKTCGAVPFIKSGGVGHSTVLIILRADANNEIRSVVDIWGERNPDWRSPTVSRQLPDLELQNIKSLYLFKHLRAVNHNVGN